MFSSFALVAAAALLQQPSCDALKTISLSRATITAVEFVAAGGTATGRGGPSTALGASL